MCAEPPRLRSATNNFSPPTSPIKFVHGTTVVSLSSNGNETNYRSTLCHLAMWCWDNDLKINMGKTGKILMAFRRTQTSNSLIINGADVESLSSTKFLDVHFMKDISCTNNTASLAREAQQLLCFYSSWEELKLPSCAPSTGTQSRAFCPTSSLCGVAPALHPTAEPFGI